MSGAGTAIEGVAVRPLRRIPDERGTVMHMLRADDPHFEKFGEIYFSTVYPGVIKGWHLHRRMTLNYAVVSGMVKLVLYDARPDSRTRGAVMEVVVGEQNYALVTVPPGVWNGFTGLGPATAIVANCATHPHDPDEIERLDPFSPSIPYRWSVKHA
jgi:dTDP-4-dehydrorhamnose 3,5-epimerase